MSSYNCDVCNFSTNLKSNYERHLKTTKHQKRIIENDNNSLLKKQKRIKNPPKPSKTLQNSLQNPPVNDKVFGCKYCGKEFSRKDNLRRHIENRCKAASENVYYKKMFIEMKNEAKNILLKKDIHLDLTLKEAIKKSIYRYLKNFRMVT